MRKFIIDGAEYEEDEFRSSFEEAVENYVSENYDDLLDSCYPEVEVAGMTFSPSQVLKNCDPVAYRCGVADEVSRDLDDGWSELEGGGEVSYDGRTFEIRDEDDED